MICDLGDVAVVPFPFTDMAVLKRRPALVISKRDFNERNENTVLAMITTARGSSWPSDISLSDPAAAGLHAASYVRWKIFTIPNDMIMRTTGSVGKGDKKAVTAALRGMFG